MSTINLYNKIFEDEAYNYKSDYKIRIVKHWLEEINPRKILDMGCGRGHYINDLDFPITGVEPSKTLCEVHPWINASIIKFYKENTDNWDALYCMDVLEHIPLKRINENLMALSQIAPKALIGIANHSDIQQGVELHLIQQPAEWWHKKLKKYYKRVTKTYEPPNYMVFECSQ